MTGGGGGSADQTQTSTSKTTGDESNVAGSRLIKFGDLDGSSISIAESGLSEEGAVSLMQTVLGAAGSILNANNDRWASVADQQAQAVSDIAKSATGTESEVGRLVNKFGLPVLLGLAAIFGIGWIIHTVVKSLRVERYKLDTATLGLLVHVSGSFLLVRRTSSAGVEIGVQLEDRDHPTIPLTDGEGWQHLAYNRLYLTWSAQPNQWIELAFQGNPLEADISKFQLFKRSDKSNVQVTNDSLAPVPVSAPSALPVSAAGTFPVSGGVTVTGNVATTQGEPTIPTGTAITIWLDSYSTTWTDAYTVPGGKTCLLDGLFFENHSQPNGQMRIIDSGGTVRYLIGGMHPGLNSIAHTKLCAGWRLPAGWKIQVKATYQAVISGAGWEQ